MNTRTLTQHFASAFNQGFHVAANIRLVKMVIVALLTMLSSATIAPAATLYWDGTTTTANADGGNGTWDISTANWDTAAIGGANAIWSNAPPDSAVFGGTAGTVTLGTGITTGGLQFDTTGYILASDTGTRTLSFASGNNTILFNNIAAASTTAIVGTGVKLSGTGNVILSTSNPATPGTLTLQYAVAGDFSTGWSGSTTINPGMTLSLNGRDLSLSSTSGITLNGGGITLTNTNSTQGAFDRVNNSAGITANGGTITYTNTSGSGLIYAETLGSVGLNRGQTNFALTNNMGGGGGNVQTLTLSGLTRTGASNTSAVSFGSASGLNTTTNIIAVSGATGPGSSGSTSSVAIIGPWAFYGTTPASPTDYAVYDASGRVLNASISGTAENSAFWVPGNNVTLNAPTTLTGTRTVNTLRYSGGAGNLDLGASNFNLETYGLLNGGSGLTVQTTGTGALTTPTGGGNLYLTPGAAAITVSAPINDNGNAVTLVKSGSNTLTLSSTTSNYSGGTVLNAGTLVTTADSNLGSGGGITVNGAATWSAGPASPVTYNRSLTVNEGAVLSLASGNAGKTITGVLSGNGSIVNVATTGFAFTNTGNTFTGTVNSGYAMSFASLGDSSNPVNFSGGSFTWTGGAKTFALRQFTLNAAGAATLNNDGSGALTIQQPLAFTGAAGARTLTLGGSYATSANTFAGNIADGPGSVVSFTKGGGNNLWALAGTNTYTGTTTISYGDDNGILIFQGMQALSPSTSFNQSQPGLNTRAGTIRFLDDSATPTSRSGVNLNFSNIEGVGTGDLRHWMRVFVGNNSTANLGTSASTQTGSTIQLGNFNLSEGATGSTGGGLWVTGANGYRLQIADVNVTLQASTAVNHQVTLRADNPMTVTGTVRQANDASVGSNTTLQLEGSAAGSLISGNIENSAGGRLMNVSKAGTGTWTLSGTNGYTGTTTVSGGLLRFTGNSSAATGNVTVSGGSLGGTGSLGGAVTVSSTGGIDLRDGAVGGTPLTLGSTLSITGAAGANNLYFDLGNGSGTSDQISVAGTTTVTTTGAAVINLNQLGGLAGRTATTYTLIGGAGTLDATNFAKFSLATTAAFGQTYALTNTGNDLQVVATNVSSATAAAFWAGGGNNWSTTTNWRSTVAGGGAVAGAPDYQTNVTFNTTTPVAANLTTNVLDVDFDINSLNFSNTSAVTIGGTKMLTIEATNANGNTAGRGITSTQTTVTNTISSKIGLAASQEWSVAGSTAALGGLTVSGVISDFGGGYGLTKSGSGTLTISAAPTYTGATTITGGTFDVSAIVSGSAFTPLPTSNIAFTTANSTFKAASSGSFTVTYPAMSIASGITVTFDRGSGGNNTPFAIPSLSGDGTLVVVNPGAGAGAGITFGTTASFTGNIDFNGTVGYFISTPDLTDTASRKIRMSSGSASQTPTFNYTGSANLTLNNRQFELYGTTANTPFAINNNGTGIFTINTDLANIASGTKTLTLGGSTAISNVFGGSITNGSGGGTVNISKAGASTWSLTHVNNTFTGTITVNAGTLAYASANGANPITFSNTTGGATLSYIGATDKTMSGAITASTVTTGTVTLDSSGAGAVNYSNTASLGTAGSGNKNLVLSGTSTGNNILAGGWNNNTGGAATITKNGTGKWVLSGTNNYTGITVVNAGTLQFAKEASLYNGTPASWTALNINVKSGATLAVNVDSAGTNGFTVANLDTLLGNISVASSATSGLQTGATLGFDTSTATGGTFTQGNLIANSTGANGGVISVTKLGTGILVFDEANTYTGATTISAGTLQLGSGGTGGSLNTFSQIINDSVLAFNRSNTLTQGTDFDAVFGGTGAVQQNGTGSTVLSGLNTYTGTTTVNAGTLLVGSNAPNAAAGALGNASSAVLVGDTSGVANASLLTNGAFTVGRAVTVQAGSSGAATLGGNAAAISSFSGLVTLNKNVQLSQVSGGTTTFSGDISGSGFGVTKVEAGTVVLSGAKSYSGNTTVSAGTLALSHGSSNNIASSPTITVASGAFLDVTGLSGGTLALANNQTLTGTGTVTGGVIIGGTGAKLAPGNSPGTLSTGAATYAPSGTYVWEINTVAPGGTQGADPGWDHHAVTGGLTISATSGSEYNIDITGMNPSNVLGIVSGFNKFAGYTWNITTATSAITIGGPTGFDASDFILADGNFTANNSITGTATNGGFSIQAVGNDLQLVYSAAVNAAPTTAYWQGDESSIWTTNNGPGDTNWATDAAGTTDASALPDNTTDVIFTVNTGVGANFITTLGANFSINSLTFTGAGTDAATNSVTIGGANTLTLGAGGLTVQTGSAAHTISTDVALLTAQTWTNDGGLLTVSGDITNGGATLTVAGTGNTEISGAILGSGAGGLNKDGTGTLTLSGMSANTYLGATNVNDGTLLLSKTPGVNAIAGPGTITVGDGSAPSAVLSLGASNQIFDAVSVTVNSDGTFQLNTFSETVDAVTVATGGTISLGTSGTLTTGFSGGTSSVTGIGSGPGAITGTGTLNIGGGGLTMGPATLISAGAVNLNSGTLLTDSTATIMGNFTAASGTTIDVGGVGTIGTLNLVGAVTMAAGMTFNFDLGAPGTNDQIAVTGTVDLGLIDLDDLVFNDIGGFGVGNYVLFDGSSVPINLGPNVMGTFGGLNITLAISGDDVVLTAADATVVPEPATIAIWSLLGLLAICSVQRLRRRK